MQPASNTTCVATQKKSHPGHRPAEHGCAALLLERLRKAAREDETPSTADLQGERVYGLRPVNRIGDLIRGKYNVTRYDIERLDCKHGVYRWRLHEPARPGYPKPKNQTVLSLVPSDGTPPRQHGPSPGPVRSKPAEQVSDYIRRIREEESAAAPLFVGVGQ